MERVEKFFAFGVLTLCTIFILCSIFVMIIAVPSFSSKTISKTYTIDSIFVGGVKDIVFVDQEDSTSLYINRGLEEYSLEYFESRLLQTPATFTYRSHRLKKIVEIECEGDVIYKL